MQKLAPQPFLFLFAADIVNRNMDDVLRKDRRGSINTVTTRRPLPIAVTGDKIVLYTAKASSSCGLEVELEAAPLKPSPTLVKLNVFMKNSQCVAERYAMISIPLKPISSLQFCISLYRTYNISGKYTLKLPNRT